MITNKQGIQILQKFFDFSYNFDQLTQYFSSSKRTKQQLTQFIKQKLKQIILQIQYNLYRAGKITKLKFYDNTSEYMFNQLIKLSNYFPSKLSYDFVYEQKCKYTKIQKSTTNKKIQLYTIFYNYAEQNDLFKYICVDSQDKIVNKGPYQNPYHIYQYQQLELICLFYDIYNADVNTIENKFKQRQNVPQKLCSDKLYKNIQNLLMIGLFRCQIKSTGGKAITWQKFIQNYDQNLQLIQKWQNNLKIILIKLAIRNQVTNQQIRAICRKIGKRYKDKPFIDTLKAPALTNQQKYNNMPEINKLRQELLAILNVKIWFNNVNLNYQDA